MKTSYFLVLHPYVVSPEKKRKINNNLAVLPSHDITDSIVYQVALLPFYNSLCSSG